MKPSTSLIKSQQGWSDFISGMTPPKHARGGDTEEVKKMLPDVEAEQRNP